ncbi:MAG: hypothetical protein HOJ00_06380 [Phycisphaerae bacterium]|jgi:hypothetical protein|nr:hypothetical protein [Phycisphaerae bacterium]MBT6165681.1 hypothetical protein [Phycisphaerae bacterium]MBT6282992.1 hypothetical protein [Phycisphaerae bacterium]MBT7657261.1 hypothetical protein [Phycisphaerae bacterium]
MSVADTAVLNRKSPPNVFTVLLVVATLLLAGGVAWMVLVNTEHSKLNDRSEGGPLVLIDQQ